jgi:DNA-binding winged helix-turn-helix (wHTH) protein
MNSFDKEGQKRKLVQSIIKELKKTFSNAPHLLEQIRTLEEAGFNINITLVTAVAIEENKDKKNQDSGAQKGKKKRKTMSTLQLTTDDKKFLSSLRISF